MFCTQCGEEVKSGASFCSRCGAKVAAIEEPAAPEPAASADETAPLSPTPAAETAPLEPVAPAAPAVSVAPAAKTARLEPVAPAVPAASAPAPAPASAAAPAAKPVNRTVIIVAAIIAVAVIAIALILALSAKSPSNSIDYSTSKRIVISESAPITVCDDNDKPLTHFTLTVVREDGSIRCYEVSGDSFTFKGIGEDPGSVTVFVRDENSDFSRDMPIDEIATESDAANTSTDDEKEVITGATTIRKQASGGTDNTNGSEDDANANRAANLALYTKFLELKSTYGEVERVTASGGAHVLDGVGILLFDVDGDGVDEMISVALDASADSSKGASNVVDKYQVSVWRYNSSTHAVESIHDTKISHGTNGSNSYVPIHTDSNGLVSIGSETHTNLSGSTYSFFGYNATSKEFGTVFSASSTTSSGSDGSYVVNGENATNTSFASSVNDWLSKVTHYSITDQSSDTSGKSTSETVSEMKAAEKTLKSAAFATTRSTSSSSSSADAKELFSQIPSSFTNMSGAGAWANEVTINSDGTYTGQFHDADMGVTGSGYPGGTVYICNYSGKFTNVKKVDEYTYTMEIESETREGTPNEEKIENQIRYITADAGLGTPGTSITVYLSGRATSDIPSAILLWNATLSEQKASTLKRWCLAVDGDTGFYNYS